MKVALYEVITPGNVGAVARAMKNFGFKELLLIRPQCNHLSEESFQRACHGDSVLKNARIISEAELFKGFVVGTTSKAFTRKSHRQAVTPKQLDFLPKDSILLFGREDNGLPNEVLKKCNSLINIPTGTKYTSLNLSHAVTIVLYDLKDWKPKKRLVSPALRDKLIEVFYELSDLTDRRITMKGYLKNIVNRSIIYENEAKALIGLLEEVKKSIK